MELPCLIIVAMVSTVPIWPLVNRNPAEVAYDTTNRMSKMDVSYDFDGKRLFAHPHLGI